MKVIYKQTLVLVERQRVAIPREARILCVQVQREDICIWYETDDLEKANYDRGIAIAGTGHKVPGGSVYLGTVQIGAFVWHVYEVAL